MIKRGALLGQARCPRQLLGLSLLARSRESGHCDRHTPSLWRCGAASACPHCDTQESSDPFWGPAMSQLAANGHYWHTVGKGISTALPCSSAPKLLHARMAQTMRLGDDACGVPQSQGSC